MSNRDGSIWIVYNGEVYNFRALREELKAKGYVFTSDSDTEVILALYEVYGVDMIHKLRGMFAFGIWDSRKQQLFLVRDRLGIKPLFYAPYQKGLLFASELRGIVSNGLISKTLNEQALKSYLSFGSVEDPLTIYESIQSLLPGHFLVCSENELKIQKYWDLTFPEIYAQKSEQAWVEELRSVLSESIEMRMISDVPLGAFLSGGLDSTGVVGVMHDRSSQPVETYSLGFDMGQDEYDERHFAKQAAEYYGCYHTESCVSLQEIMDTLPHFILSMGQPSVDGLNSFLVSKLTREGVTVALSGLGADELFGGYTSFRFVDRLARFGPFTDKLPGFFANLARSANRRLPDPLRSNWYWMGATGVLGRFEYVGDAYRTIRTLMADDVMKNLTQGLAGDMAHESVTSIDTADYLHPLNAVSLLELTGYMRNTLLRDIDQMSMAHSLEVRVPFLDHVLVEFVAQIPPELKFKECGSKYLLVEALRDILPPFVIDRRKSGFNLPYDLWLRHPKMREMVAELFSKEALKKQSLLNYESVQKLIQRFYDSKPSKSKNYYLCQKVWQIFVLQYWARYHL